MNPTIDEFLYILKDVGTNKEVRARFDERDKKDLRIKGVTISFRPTGNRVEGKMQMDFEDPNQQQKNEDLIITLELSGEYWKIIDVRPSKL